MWNYKSIFKYLYSILPSFAKKNIEVQRKKRKKAAISKRMNSIYISEAELDDIFSKFELGCDVFLHSSLTNIGTIEGGVPLVCKKILEKVNIQTNTLLVPALPIQGTFIDYLYEKPVFDVRTAPIKMGAISEYFSKMQEAKRSIHPTHSVVAIGANADKYISHHHIDNTPFGVRSPYYKLLENKAKILYLGVTPYVTTYVHVIEDIFSDIFPVKVYTDEIFEVTCLNSFGKSLTVKTKAHDPKASITRNVLILNDFFDYDNAILFNHPIGDSHILIVDVHRLTIAYLHAMQQGITIYGNFKVTPVLQERISMLLTDLEK